MPRLAWHPNVEQQLWLAWGDDDARSLMQIDVVEGSVVENIPVDNLIELSWRRDGQVAALSRHSPFTIGLFDPELMTINTRLMADELQRSGVFHWLPQSTDLFSVHCFGGIEACHYWVWSDDRTIIRPEVTDGALTRPTPVVFAMNHSAEMLAISLGGDARLYIVDADNLAVRLVLDDFVSRPYEMTWTDERTLYVSDGVLKVFSIR